MARSFEERVMGSPWVLIDFSDLRLDSERDVLRTGVGKRHSGVIGVGGERTRSGRNDLGQKT